MEFIQTVYPPRHKTLYPQVQQLEAGTYAQISDAGEIDANEYYQYYHHPEERELEDFAGELKDVFYSVFQDVLARLKNKTAVIPLSGGYDSRIIALMLKEFGMDNIVAFTYGKKDNAEARVSKSMADRLGLDWKFVEYRREDWKKWSESDEWKEYVQFAANGTSVAHIQDFPATKEIVREHPGDLVFVPGHSGDFVAGSHLPYEITLDKPYTKDEVVQFILDKHFRLWELRGGIRTNAPDVVREIEASFGELPYENKEEASALFEYWDWRERQAKFIINSLRVYEFYEKSWDIPLWDDRFMEFFKKVPVKWRYKKYLYDYTLHKMFPDYFPKPTGEMSPSLKQKYGRLYPLAKKLYNKMRILSQYHKDPKGWFGICGDYGNYLKQLSFMYDHHIFKQPSNITSFLAKDYILSINRKKK